MRFPPWIGVVALALCFAAAIGWMAFGEGGKDSPAEVERPVEPEPELVIDAAIAQQAAGADAEQRVTVEASPSGLSVVGRLLGPDGMPWSNASPSYTVQVVGVARSSGEISTDANGVFVVPIRPDGVGPALVGSIEIRDGVGAGSVGATAEFSGTATESRLDVGDLRLAGYVLIASGRVSDDLGRPVADAEVEVFRKRAVKRPEVGGISSKRMRDAELRLMEAIRRGNTELGSRLSVESPVLNRADAAAMRFFIGEGSATESRQLPLAHARTAADGTFSAYAAESVAPLRVVAEAEGHRSAAGLVVDAARWIELQMVRTSALSGSALLPDWLPALAVEFVLAIDGERTRVAQGEADGRFARFRFDDLAIGTCDLSVRLKNLPDPVRQIRRITIQPGTDRPDPRTHAIDLSGSVYRYRLRAVDERGAPLRTLASPLLARIERPDGSTRVAAFTWSLGRAELFSATPSLELTVLAAGFRREEVRVTAGPSDVVFRPNHPVEIVVPGLRALCGPKRKVRVSMILQSGTGLPQGMTGIDQRSGSSKSFSRWHLGKSGGAWLGETDAVHVPLVIDGKYQVVLRLHQEGVAGDVSLPVATVPVKLEGALPSRHVIEVDEAVIQRGLEQLRARAGV